MQNDQCPFESFGLAEVQGSGSTSNFLSNFTKKNFTSSHLPLQTMSSISRKRSRNQFEYETDTEYDSDDDTKVYTALCTPIGKKRRLSFQFANLTVTPLHLRTTTPFSQIKKKTKPRRDDGWWRELLEESMKVPKQFITEYFPSVDDIDKAFLPYYFKKENNYEVPQYDNIKIPKIVKKAPFIIRRNRLRKKNKVSDIKKRKSEQLLLEDCWEKLFQ